MENTPNKKSMKKLALSSELELYRKDLEKTVSPYIKIKPLCNENLELYNSKIGGIPYLHPDFRGLKIVMESRCFFLHN